MTTATERPVLTLEALEAFDPHAPLGGRERRFCCPLSDCADKPIDAVHRSLSVNVETGAFVCYRCGGRGVLKEHWQPRRERQQARLRRAFALDRSPRAAPAPDRDGLLDAALAAAQPLAGTPGVAYLEGRGVSWLAAMRCDVWFSASFVGRAAVLFPLIDPDGRVVALHGRHLDDGEPKAHTLGHKHEGVFWVPTACAQPVLVLVEGPLDALALATVGYPALALCGTSAPDWLPCFCAFRRVALALDADDAGDRAAAQLAVRLRSLGSEVERWRPEGAKDWAEALERDGRDALAALLRSATGQARAAG